MPASVDMPLRRAGAEVATTRSRRLRARRQRRVSAMISRDHGELAAAKRGPTKRTRAPARRRRSTGVITAPKRAPSSRASASRQSITRGSRTTPSGVTYPTRAPR
jgi:hypothetical protein